MHAPWFAAGKTHLSTEVGSSVTPATVLVAGSVPRVRPEIEFSMSMLFGRAAARYVVPAKLQDHSEVQQELLQVITHVGRKLQAYHEC